MNLELDNGNHQVDVYPKDEHNATLVANVHPPDWQNPNPAPIYNLVVIGGGSAGLLAVAAAAGMGAKVALVEKELLGGDCLITGCVPSKTVIRSAKAMGDLRMAKELGIIVPKGVKVDFGAVMERMRRIRAHISHHDSVYRFTDLNVDVFLGAGNFSGPNTITVGGKTLKFKKAVIATGSRARIPAIKGLQEAGYITNETFFSLTERPERVAVIGAGPIGSELGQSLQRLGSQVTILDMGSQILMREDKDAAEIVQQAMLDDGVELVFNVKLNEITKKGNNKILHFEHQGEEKTLAVDEILVSAGRTPNVEINLEAAGINYHKRGVEVNDFLQTTNPNVYAAGDVCLKYQFTHTADAAARIVLQNALFKGRKKFSALTIPWCTYTDPEIAHVGMYPHDAEAAGFEIETFTQSFAEIDRAMADGEEDGFVKVHVKKGNDKIVGATIVARHAGEMISEITTAMVGNVGLKTLAQVIHPYPTQAEAIKKVADAYNRTRFTPTVQKAFLKWFAFNRRKENPPPTTNITGAIEKSKGIKKPFALGALLAALLVIIGIKKCKIHLE